MTGYSAAGQMLFATSAAAPSETEEEKRRRLAAVAQQADKLGARSPAGAALFGGYGGAVGGYGMG